MYDEYIRELLNNYDDAHYTCDRSEFFRALRRRGDGDGKLQWRKQYYYRCLTIILAQAFIGALEDCRNYVTTDDVFEYFPHYNFSLLFRKICRVMHGSYDRGKCYTYLTDKDYIQFLRFRNQTKTADDLLREWNKYVEQVLPTRRAHFAAYMAECRQRRQAEAAAVTATAAIPNLGDGGGEA